MKKSWDDMDWKLSTEAAKQLQNELAPRVILQNQLPETIKTVAGVDVGFEQDYRITRAAVAVLSFPDLQCLEYRIARVPTNFPYVPGYLSFREIPAVLPALEQLSIEPEVLLCDGQGIAHPRRLGIASHLGVITGIPCIGVAKTRFIGEYEEPGEQKGQYSLLYDQGEVIGAVLRTRSGVKPLYVSPGHKVDLKTTIQLVMACVSRYRLPETTRWADRIASDKTGAYG